MFSVPDSSPPSTPDSHRDSRDQPSTTPAGPPPSNLTHKSFTPAGQPPSSVFASSQFGSGDSRIPAPNFGSSKLTGKSSPRNANAFNTFSRNQDANLFKPSNLKGFTVPDSSPPPQNSAGYDLQDDGGVRFEEEDAMDEDDDGGGRLALSNNQRDPGSSILGYSRQSTRRSGLGQSIGETIELEQSAAISELERTAKGLTTSLPSPSLHESNRVIVETDRELRQLYEEGSGDLSAAFAQTAGRLRDLWADESKSESRKTRDPNSIGPGRSDSGFSKAQFVNDLLLQLHHPPRGQVKQSLNTSRFGRSSRGPDTHSAHPTPYPKVLLDWLNDNHDPTEADLEDVLRQTKGYSASEAFWDVVFASLCRGKFTQVIKLLKGANFSVAESAKMDGFEDAGYEGRQLQQTSIAVDRAIKLLEDCPAVRQDDWNITGSDWSIWRHSVRKAIESLRSQADKASALDEDDFGASTRSNVFGISTSSRRPESQLPSFIYESLLDMFNSLLGSSLEVVKSACDWLEAVVGMTVWWDGEDESVPAGSLALSRRSLRKSQHGRLVDVAPSDAYPQRLRWAINYVLENEEEQLQVDMSNLVEVSLACVFAGEVESVLNASQRWSMTIASATAEIASAGRWASLKSNSRSLIKGLDQSDLMVLGYPDEEKPMSTKDGILTAYADLLGDRDSVAFDEATKHLTGWNIAVQVLGRLDDGDLADARIGGLFDRLPLESEQQVQEVLTLCDQMGLSNEVRKIAERHGDHLRATSNLYGPALLFYARAHNAAKLKDVLDLLVSHCLVTSKAYPPLNECDPTLRKLVRTPKGALDDLDSADPEAARLLSVYLSGYAALRRFYDLRDAEVTSETTDLSRLALPARKREAINALVAVIQSANDSIKGGLYDSSVEVVVQVDGLLTLLGEALVFLDDSGPPLTLRQTFAILRATEDLQNVASGIYQQCEALLRATLENYYDGSVPVALSPAKDTQKQQSRSLGPSQGSGLSGSQFSLLEHSGHSSQFEANSASSGSEMLVKKHGPTELRTNARSNGRGWDWRSGFARGTNGKDVLSVLRLALANQVADGWMTEE